MASSEFDTDSACAALCGQLKELVFADPHAFYAEAFQLVDALYPECTAKDHLIAAPDDDPEQQARVWIETVIDEPFEVPACAGPVLRIPWVIVGKTHQNVCSKFVCW